jgi:O-antigen/teichoic acid export membrane protein
MGSKNQVTRNPILSIKSVFGSIFFSGQERTIRTKKNIVLMAILKGISIASGFLLVPLTLNYLNATNYGIWLTLSSIIGWFSFFDIGLGNGLRNKFAEAMAHHDIHLAKIYVSTTYFFLSIIIGAIFVLFIPLTALLDWTRILNAHNSSSENLSLVVFITFSFFCLRFVLGLIGTILIADQKPALNSLLDVSGNLLSLIIIFILVKYTAGSLAYLSIALGMSTTLVLLVSSIWFFSGSYKNIRPSWSHFKSAYAKELMTLGIRFLILQLGAVIVFSTSNILITQLFTPADVVPYNIAFKYYNLISMLFAIILSPFWSAYTEAYAKGDIRWVQNTITILKKAWMIAAISVLIMSFCADLFYHFWIGNSVTIPLDISISMGIYVLLSAWCNIFVNFINGTGKISLQVFAGITISILNIPLAILFVRSFNWGIPGIILAPCVCLVPLCFLWPLQVKKILSGNARGIWNR